MKYLAVGFVLVLMSGAVAQEQEEGVGFMGGGIKVGQAWSTPSTNIPEFREAGSSAAFTIGAFGTYNITPALAVQPELLYVQKGYWETGLFVDEGFKLRYLDIPLLVKYDLVRTGKTIPRLYLGPAVGILLDANLYDYGIFSDEDFDVKDGMKSVDFCLVFGGEVEVSSIRIGKLMVDVRYSLSLSSSIDPTEWNDAAKVVDDGYHWGYEFDFEEYDRPYLEDGANIKNGVFSVMVGYRF
jgi:hypothetical protein